MNGLNFKFQHKKGRITKISKGRYQLEMGDISIDNFSDVFTPTEQVMFRLLSGLLRHGVPVKFIVEQLNKAIDDITSLATAASRVLKKYITDGEVAIGVECPSCKNINTLTYKDGCVECSICQWSKC